MSILDIGLTEQLELTKSEMDQLKRGLTPASVKDKLAKKQAEFNVARLESEKNLTWKDAMTQNLNIPVAIDGKAADASSKDTDFCSHPRLRPSECMCLAGP